MTKSTIMKAKHEQVAACRQRVDTGVERVLKIRSLKITYLCKIWSPEFIFYYIKYIKL